MDSDLRACRACKRPIRWILTEKGKPMPCDPLGVRFNPGKGPETFVTVNGKTMRGQRCEDGSETGFISHFATCPEADRFRSRDKKED